MRMSKQGEFPAAAGLSNKLVIAYCDRTPLNCPQTVTEDPDATQIRHLMKNCPFIG